MISAVTDTGPSTMPPDTGGSASIHERGILDDQREHDRQHSGVPPQMQDQINTSQASATPAQQLAGNDGTGSSQRPSLAQNFGRGMSWEGLLGGSWIRDDVIIFGTPPSYHFPSDLTKLEAYFMKHSACCGRTLPTLHESLDHYAVEHYQKPPAANNDQGATGDLPKPAQHQQALLPTAETNAIPESRSRSAPPHSKEMASSLVSWCRMFGI